MVHRSFTVPSAVLTMSHGTLAGVTIAGVKGCLAALVVTSRTKYAPSTQLMQGTERLTSTGGMPSSMQHSADCKQEECRHATPAW